MSFLCLTYLITLILKVARNFYSMQGDHFSDSIIHYFFLDIINLSYYRTLLLNFNTLKLGGFKNRETSGTVPTLQRVYHYFFLFFWGGDFCGHKLMKALNVMSLTHNLLFG